MTTSWVYYFVRMTGEFEVGCWQILEPPWIFFFILIMLISNYFKIVTQDICVLLFRKICGFVCILIFEFGSWGVMYIHYGK